MYYKTYVVYEIDNIPEKNDIRTNFVSGWKFMNLDKIFNGEFVHWSKFFFFFAKFYFIKINEFVEISMLILIKMSR